MVAEPELITMKEAMERLGVSKHTIGRIVREFKIPVYMNALDKRERLVDPTDIEKVKRLRQPVEIAARGKTVAAA